MQAGWTSLHCAAQAGCLDVVRHLVESGGNTGVECQAGRTPLQHAAMETHLHSLSFLLRRADNNTLRLLEDRKVWTHTYKHTHTSILNKQMYIYMCVWIID